MTQEGLGEVDQKVYLPFRPRPALPQRALTPVERASAAATYAASRPTP
jgi:hypothetical protein